MDWYFHFLSGFHFLTIIQFTWAGRTPFGHIQKILPLSRCGLILYPFLSIGSPTSSVQRLTFSRMQWWSFPLQRVDSQSSKIPIIEPNYQHIPRQSFLQDSICPDSFSLWRGWFYRSGVSLRIFRVSKRIAWEYCWIGWTFQFAGEPMIFLWVSLSRQLHVYFLLLRPSFLKSKIVSTCVVEFVSVFEQA